MALLQHSRSSAITASSRSPSPVSKVGTAAVFYGKKHRKRGNVDSLDKSENDNVEDSESPISMKWSKERKSRYYKAFRICLQGAFMASFTSTQFAFPDLETPIINYSKKITSEMNDEIMTRISKNSNSKISRNRKNTSSQEKKSTPAITRSVVKATYNAGFLGSGFGLIPGFLVDVFGPSTTCMIGAIASGICVSLFAAAIQFQIAALLPISMFVYMNACKGMFMATLIVAMRVVPDRYVGLATGVFMTIDLFSGIQFKAIYNGFFGEDTLVLFHYCFACFIFFLGFCSAATYWRYWERNQERKKNIFSCCFRRHKDLNPPQIQIIDSSSSTEENNSTSEDNSSEENSTCDDTSVPLVCGEKLDDDRKKNYDTFGNNKNDTDDVVDGILQQRNSFKISQNDTLNSSTISIALENPAAKKRATIGIFALLFIMATGPSQGLAFNYLKTVALKSIRKAREGEFLTIKKLDSIFSDNNRSQGNEWFGVNIEDGQVVNDRNNFDSTSAFSTTYSSSNYINFKYAEDKELPKLRFMQGEAFEDLCSLTYSADDLRNAADDFGAHILLEGFRVKTKIYNIYHVELDVRVPIFGPVQKNISNTSIENNINDIEREDYDIGAFRFEPRTCKLRYEKDVALFFIHKESVSRLEKLLNKDVNTGKRVTSSSIADKANATEKSNNTEKPKEEILAEKLGTVFLLLGGAGRFSSGFFSDLTLIKLGIPKSFYFILAMIAMGVAFVFLTLRGWTADSNKTKKFGSFDNSNDLNLADYSGLAEGDDQILVWVTVVLGYGYGMFGATSPIYVKSILPTHMIGRFYGLGMMSLCIGNTVFNSCFRLGTSLLSEKWYPKPDQCIGPHCVDDFLRTASFFLGLCASVGILMVVNDLVYVIKYC